MNQHTVKAYGDELNQLTAEVARMGGLAEAQVADAVESVARRDIALARAVVDRDSKLDAMHRDIDEHYTALFRELLTYMLGDPRTISACTHLLFMAKNLERIGDHATNIAEVIHYEITGDEMTGERPRWQPTPGDWDADTGHMPPPATN